MKNLFFAAALLVSLSSFAAGRSVAERIDYATDILKSIADSSQKFTTQSKGDVDKMMLELSLAQGWYESAEDFNEHYKKDGSAWEVDGGLIGTETTAGAIDYIKGAAERRLSEESEQTQADKVKFADAILAVKKAFDVLTSIKSVKYGVIPSGPVQCGVTFPSLLIIDTENGRATSISMDGDSGC